MNCKVCGNQLPTDNAFATTNICSNCFEELSDDKQEALQAEEALYHKSLAGTTFTLKRYGWVALAVMVVVFILTSISKIQIENSWLLHILGVAVVAGIMYWLYETMMQLLLGTVVIAGGLVSYFLSHGEFLSPVIAVVICGAVVGVIVTPFLVIVDVKRLKNKGSDKEE